MHLGGEQGAESSLPGRAAVSTSDADAAFESFQSRTRTTRVRCSGGRRVQGPGSDQRIRSLRMTRWTGR